MARRDTSRDLSSNGRNGTAARSAAARQQRSGDPQEQQNTERDDDGRPLLDGEGTGIAGGPADTFPDPDPRGNGADDRTLAPLFINGDPPLLAKEIAKIRISKLVTNASGIVSRQLLAIDSKIWVPNPYTTDEEELGRRLRPGFYYLEPVNVHGRIMKGARKITLGAADQALREMRGGGGGGVNFAAGARSALDGFPPSEGVAGEDSDLDGARDDEPGGGGGSSLDSAARMARGRWQAMPPRPEGVFVDPQNPPAIPITTAEGNTIFTIPGLSGAKQAESLFAQQQLADAKEMIRRQEEKLEAERKELREQARMAAALPTATPIGQLKELTSALAPLFERFGPQQAAAANSIGEEKARLLEDQLQMYRREIAKRDEQIDELRKDHRRELERSDDAARSKLSTIERALEDKIRTLEKRVEELQQRNFKLEREKLEAEADANEFERTAKSAEEQAEMIANTPPAAATELPKTATEAMAGIGMSVFQALPKLPQILRQVREIQKAGGLKSMGLGGSEEDEEGELPVEN